MGKLWTDLRHGARVLVRDPGPSALAVLCLGVGIGLLATMFQSADPWLFRPLPYRAPQELAAVREADPSGKAHLASVPTYYAWKDDSTSFAGVGAVVRVAFNLSTEDEPERVEAASITASLFPMLGVGPREGRAFTAEDDRPGGPKVCLIGSEMWRRRFAGRPQVVGEVLKIDGEAHTIVGIMPEGWAFPDYAEVWTPLRLDPADRNRERRGLDVMARLRPGVTVEAARAELDPLARRAAAEHPETSRGWGYRVTPLLEDLTPPGIRWALLLMIGAALFVLLIACANVASLLLARGADRRREIATRLALGAGPAQVVRQMLAESLVLALAGGAVGVALAVWGNALMAGAVPIRPPFWAAMVMNPRVVATLVLSCGLAAIVSGLVPALDAARQDIRSGLQDGARGSSAGQRSRRLGRALVAAELAASVVLLSGALLMIRSFRERQGVDLGFDPRGAFSARLTLSGERYREASARYAFLDLVLRRIRTLPGVTSAAAASSLPFSDELGGGFSTATFEVDGREVPAAERPSTVVQAVTVDALATFGIAILDGRGFVEAEVAEGADTVVVSEGLARRFWPGADPLGRRLRLSSGDWLRVIGVAREVKEASSILGLDLKPAWQIYLPYPRRPTSTVTLVVRGGATDSLAGPVREAVRGLDPLLPFYEARTLEEARRRADWVARLWGQILTWAAGAGTLLACVGVYGVVGRGVARRTNEIGIRMALGADRGAVLRLVLAQSLRPSLLGVGLGVLAALGVTRSLSGLLYGVSASDPLTLLGSGLLLTGVATLATYLPARRAATIDPIAALRSE